MILSFLLLNTLDDGVIRSNLPFGVKAIGFDDDVIVIMADKNCKILQ